VGSAGDERPQLTRLESFGATSPDAATDADSFQRFFEAGAFTESYLLAVGGGPVQNLDAVGFRAAWENAPTESRIFMSFSGADIDYAEAVKQAMEAQGYSVFLYRPSVDQGPLTNSVEVGQYFREAGHHLVIDTPNARQSQAVLVEAAAWRFLFGGGGTPTPTSPPPIAPAPPPPDPATAAPPVPEGTEPPSEDGEPCCQLCTYRDGVLINCGPTECGPQCAGAQ